MLVFGDRSERAEPRERLAAIDNALRRLVAMPPGLDRHSAIAAALIESGRLLQGVADADFAEAGHDRQTPQTRSLGQWAFGLAGMLCLSWDSGFSEVGELPPLPDAGDLPGAVELKTPEGFAFYAVYPEAYVEAARRLHLLATPRVIGVRSIGTTLGAIVAAALDAEPPITVRPFGDPFARQLAVSAELERDLFDRDAHYIIVDEGPGQSGSSFGAVADWLQERSVPIERIAFLPSHGGPLGPQASNVHRRRWQIAQRESAEFDAQLPQLVSAWASNLIGPLEGEPDDISAGEWRGHVFSDRSEWPPVLSMFERRKFLVSSGGAQFLVKFTGLGAIGDAKLRMAGALYAEGFAPEPIGLAHGFLVERWRGDATPLAPGDQPIEAIGRYLGTRARLFPAAEADGASVAELYEMARRNISLGLGERAVQGLRPWEPKLDGLQRRVRRVRTDNRLDRHEWLRTGSGQLLKTDALDHHQAHDVVGCQDLAWDVAGAMVEFDLGGAAAERLIIASEEAAGREVDRELLEFSLIAYSSFRLGLTSMGSDLAAGDARERDRLVAASARYGSTLQHLLERSSPATRQESLVG